MDQLSAKQQSFIAKALKGENIFLTGKAGTGKSYVVKKLITILKEQGKKVIALAPTGIAANNIKGQTIHSFFSLPPFGVFVFAPLKDLK
jgi:ATP-dependent DNA helicase PIF1